MVDYSKSKHVNVLDFGADPTGTKDSAPAIQNAINSVAAVPGGGSVEIPSGIYLVSNDFINLRESIHRDFKIQLHWLLKSQCLLSKDRPLPKS